VMPVTVCNACTNGECVHGITMITCISHGIIGITCQNIAAFADGVGQVQNATTLTQSSLMEGVLY
jgi:hypothetical protein